MHPPLPYDLARIVTDYAFDGFDQRVIANLFRGYHHWPRQGETHKQSYYMFIWHVVRDRTIPTSYVHPGNCCTSLLKTGDGTYCKDMEYDMTRLGLRSYRGWFYMERDRFKCLRNRIACGVDANREVLFAIAQFARPREDTF